MNTLLRSKLTGCLHHHVILAKARIQRLKRPDTGLRQCDDIRSSTKSRRPEATVGALGGLRGIKPNRLGAHLRCRS